VRTLDDLELAHLVNFLDPFAHVSVTHPSSIGSSSSRSLSAALQARDEIDKAMTAMKISANITALLLMAFTCSIAGAQEKVIVGHSARAALSIGPLLYGIERGFYRDDGLDLVYVALRAGLGTNALRSFAMDYRS